MQLNSFGNSAEPEITKVLYINSRQKGIQLRFPQGCRRHSAAKLEIRVANEAVLFVDGFVRVDDHKTKLFVQPLVLRYDSLAKTNIALIGIVHPGDILTGFIELQRACRSDPRC